MGYNTTFDGSITVEPPLNMAEVVYLQKFAETRRMDRKRGPYYVGELTDDIIDSNSSGDMPGLWCQWVPGDDGLEWDQGEKFYEAEAWMAYLIDHFLKPDAEASKSDDPQFAEFTFDHVCNGEIYAEGEDSDDHWRLCVEDNEVRVDQGHINYEAHADAARDVEALNKIHALLSGRSWSGADDLQEIAEILVSTGREIEPPR